MGFAALIAVGFAFVVACEFFLLNDYSKIVLITVGINIILCSSLNLVNGYMGEFSSWASPGSWRSVPTPRPS